MPVNAVFCFQFGRRSLLCHHAILQYNNLVCVRHSTHAVRNDHNGLIADQPGKGFLNQCLVIYIQRSGCLIHEDDGSIL